MDPLQTGSGDSGPRWRELPGLSHLLRRCELVAPAQPAKSRAPAPGPGSTSRNQMKGGSPSVRRALFISGSLQDAWPPYATWLNERLACASICPECVLCRKGESRRFPFGGHAAPLISREPSCEWFVRQAPRADRSRPRTRLGYPIDRRHASRPDGCRRAGLRQRGRSRARP